MILNEVERKSDLLFTQLDHLLPQSQQQHLVSCFTLHVRVIQHQPQHAADQHPGASAQAHITVIYCGGRRESRILQAVMVLNFNILAHLHFAC